MLISLLTHPREIDRKTNTGKLAINLELATLFCWQRTAPDPQLLGCITQYNTALLYLTEQTDTTLAATHNATAITPQLAVQAYEHIIIVDATWQEARKIVNRSPYLQPLPRCILTPKSPSIFSLRRNQKEQGLCTAECVITILEACERTHDANTLRHALTQFIACYGRNENAP